MLLRALRVLAGTAVAQQTLHVGRSEPPQADTLTACVVFMATAACALLGAPAAFVANAFWFIIVGTVARILQQERLEGGGQWC